MPTEIPTFHVDGEKFDAGFIVSSREQSFVKVVLSVGSIVQPNSVFRFNIPGSAGIQLPYSGMASCPSGSLDLACPITVYTNSSAGPLTNFQVLQSGGIGQFRDPVMRFSPRKAGGGTNLMLSFTPEMDIAAGETVRLVLPGGFTGTAFANANISFSATHGDLGSKTRGELLVSWNGGNKTLDFMLPSRLLARSLFETTVPEILGLRLPVAGVRLVQYGRLLLTEASAGFVLGVAPETQPVGSFLYESVLDFLVPKENAVTNFTILLKPQMHMSSNETVEFLLPGFEFAQNFPVQAGFHIRTAATASWSNSNSTLIWTLAEAILPGSQIRVHIPDAALVKLPFRGVLNGTTNFAVSTQTKAGLVEFEEISRYPFVGSLAGTTNLAFASRAAEGEAVALQISFAPVMPLLLGETVEITLPNFRGTSQSRCISNTGYVQKVTWSDANSKLILTVAENIPGAQPCNSSGKSICQPDIDMHTTNDANITNRTSNCSDGNKDSSLSMMECFNSTNVTVLVPSAFGLRIPVGGLQRDLDLLVIQTRAKVAPVPPTPRAGAGATPWDRMPRPLFRTLRGPT